MDAFKIIYKNLGKWIIFIFLALFPLGQLIRLNFKFLSSPITLQPVDILAGTALFLTLLAGLKRPNFFRHFKNFLVLALFSTLLSLFYFPFTEVLVGSFYLLRLASHFYLFILTWNILKDNLLGRETLLKSLVAVSVASAIYGWIQYLTIPDLRPLSYLGWDDHLYRLAGTFLDPGFTGIIMVLGFLICLAYFVKSTSKKYLLLCMILLLTAAFTYSRASYLALFTGSFYLIFKFSKNRVIYLLLFVFLIVLPFLPRPAGEGVRLERLQSVYARGQNYRETFEIIKKYPLLGVGYNNICSERVRMFEDNFESHSCPGSDSSLLLVLATTGIVGFMAFLRLLYEVFKKLSQSLYGIIFSASFIAVLTHSFFVNSLFYPWVLAWLIVLLPTALKSPRENSGE